MNDRAIDLALNMPTVLPGIGIGSGRAAVAWPNDLGKAMADHALAGNHLFAYPEQLLYLDEAIRHERPPKKMARVWSVNGDRASIYSAALLLADGIAGGGWEMVVSDNRAEQLCAARSATFPLTACRHVPIHLVAKYCRIARCHDGGLVSLQRRICDHIYFTHTVLGELLPMFGNFDAILLGPTVLADEMRNVHLPALVRMLRVGGCLLLPGGNEQVLQMPASLDRLGTNIYQRFE